MKTSKTLERVLGVSEKDIVQISVKNVYYSYGPTNVLSDISFDIKRSDFLAILGPNGSGKTTLLKLILGIIPLSKGEIELFGKKVNDFSQWNRLGYVPQNATHIDPFFPVSVNEIVAMGLLSGKAFPRFISSKDASLIDQALEKVDMNEFKKKRIGELSGGQQQRVFIARAIVNQPDVLFLDEPTTGVDVTTQTRFYDILNSLNKSHGITIVLITHDIGVVTKYVTKVACLNQRLIYHGSHDEFCSSSFIMEFLKGEHHLVSHRH
ncbi:metal ABC transporter ATP-binding protein [bacterium]|nr:metal ABC transporter ATP-binding protein [bacterium]